MALTNDIPGIVTIRYDQLKKGDAAWIEKCTDPYSAEMLKRCAQWCMNYIKQHSTSKNGSIGITDTQARNMKGEYYRAEHVTSGTNIFIKESEKRIYLLCGDTRRLWRFFKTESRIIKKDGTEAKLKAEQQEKREAYKRKKRRHHAN